MENASKALIMAAGVLLGMMILALAVYLFASFGSSAADVEEKNRQNQLAQFNEQFTKYDGRQNLTIHDILTVANLADENNKNYELDSSNAGNENSFYIYVTAKTNRWTRIY